MDAPATTTRTYRLERPFFSLLGARCRVVDDASGQLVLFAKRRALRLREDVRVYEDEQETREALRIRTEAVLDLGATYLVSDSRTAEPLGGARRRFLRSVVRDEWTLLDATGQEIGRAQEDHVALALLRRLLGGWIPQTYRIELHGRPVAEIRQRFNPFLFRAVLRIDPGASGAIDTRLLLALGVLLMVIEGRQES